MGNIEPHQKAFCDFGEILIQSKDDINKIIEKYVFYENWLTTEAEEKGIDSTNYDYLVYITDLFRHYLADHITKQNGYYKSEADYLHRWSKEQ